MDYYELTKAFGAFFAIMNPFVNLPIFLALTTGFTVAQQRMLAMKITLFSAIMCAVILFAGQKIIGFFGITVDQGLKRRSSEIRINTLVGQTVKQSTEKQLLTGVSHFLSNRAASFESYSLAAQNIGSGDKLALVNEGDHLYLKVDLKFERAWYAVGEALARSHIPIVDWNRKEGIYYVSYEANTKQEGWFPNLFSLNDRSQASDSFNFIIELNADTTDADTTDGVYIESVPVSGSADSQDRIRLLNQLLDHMS